MTILRYRYEREHNIRKPQGKQGQTAMDTGDDTPYNKTERNLIPRAPYHCKGTYLSCPAHAPSPLQRRLFELSAASKEPFDVILEGAGA